ITPLTTRKPAGTLVDDRVGGGAAGFLVVKGVMLDAAHHLLVLYGANVRRVNLPGENGIFAFSFERAAVARLAPQIDVAAEIHVQTVRAHLGADHLPVLVSQLGVPTGGAGDGRWERCRR